MDVWLGQPALACYQRLECQPGLPSTTQMCVAQLQNRFVVGMAEATVSANWRHYLWKRAEWHVHSASGKEHCKCSDGTKMCHGVNTAQLG